MEVHSFGFIQRFVLSGVALPVSQSGALQALEDISNAELRQRVTDYLLDFAITCALLSDNPGQECGG